MSETQKEAFSEINRNLPSLPTPKTTTVHLGAIWQDQTRQRTNFQSVPSQKDFPPPLDENTFPIPRVDSQVISQQHWEAYQTLLAKNNELKKHIEEMEAIEGRAAREGAGREVRMKEESQVQKEQYTGEIERLKQEHVQIRDVYVSLQAVLNTRNR